jgi:hypothetical protein
MPGAAPGAGLNVLRSPALPPPAFGGFQPPGQESSTYEAVTQSDGTVLLHLKNPDGTLGPAVRIVSVPRPKTGVGGLPVPGAAQGGPVPGR